MSPKKRPLKGFLAPIDPWRLIPPRGSGPRPRAPSDAQQRVLVLPSMRAHATEASPGIDRARWQRGALRAVREHAFAVDGLTRPLLLAHTRSAARCTTCATPRVGSPSKAVRPCSRSACQRCAAPSWAGTRRSSLVQLQLNSDACDRYQLVGSTGLARAPAVARSDA